MQTLERLSRRELKRHYDNITRKAASYLRREYPGLAGIFVHGSVARGEPGPFSDIDIVGVTSGRKPSQFSYVDGDVYVGAGFVSVADLKKEFRDPKAFFWARGSASATRILYDPKGILRGILGRWKRAEPPHRILEDSLWDSYHNMIEYSGKLRNGWTKHDEYMTRYSAWVIAHHAERALIALNDLSVISENYVWDQVMNSKRRPKHFRTDYPLALAIIGTKDTSKVYRSALRLCRETLLLIGQDFRERAKHRRFRALLAVDIEEFGL